MFDFLLQERKFTHLSPIFNLCQEIIVCFYVDVICLCYMCVHVHKDDNLYPTYVHVHSCLCTCMCMCLCIWVHEYIYACVCMCTCMQIW